MWPDQAAIFGNGAAIGLGSITVTDLPDALWLPPTLRQVHLLDQEEF